MSPWHDPYYQKDMMRRMEQDPREVMYYIRQLMDRISILEAKVDRTPSLHTFVTTNYPEIVEQFEQVQATKKRLGAKEKP